MIIKCIENTGKNLPVEIKNVKGYSENTTFETITINKLYNVYGIGFYNNNFWFLICEDHYDDNYINYPIYMPSILFEIVDIRLSYFWTVRQKKEDMQTILEFGMKEILYEDGFYFRILEGAAKEVDFFKKYKEKIDKEIFYQQGY